MRISSILFTVTVASTGSLKKAKRREINKIEFHTIDFVLSQKIAKNAYQICRSTKIASAQVD